MTEQNNFYTEDKIKNDLDYYRAEKLAKAMLDNGLISLGEFDKLSDINFETFSPLFMGIMPKTT